MKVVAFQFEHLELFDWREHENIMYNVGSDFIEALREAEKGACFTAMHDGRILVIGGIIKRSEKTGYAFTMFSRHADTYPIVAARLVKRMFTNMIDTMGLHRVTTFNLVDAHFHHVWCEWLGFKREGRVDKFDDAGNSYYQYGLVTNGS